MSTDKYSGDHTILVEDGCLTLSSTDIEIEAEMKFASGVTISSGDLEVTTGDLTVTAGDLRAAGDLSIEGDLSAAGLAVVGITATGDIELTSGGMTIAKGDIELTLGGLSVVDGDVDAGGSVSAGGDLSAVGLSLTGAASITGKVTAGGDLETLAGDVIASGSVSAGGSISAGGSLYGTSVIASGNMSVVNITASGDMTMQDCTVNGDLDADITNYSSDGSYVSLRDGIFSWKNSAGIDQSSMEQVADALELYNKLNQSKISIGAALMGEVQETNLFELSHNKYLFNSPMTKMEFMIGQTGPTFPDPNEEAEWNLINFNNKITMDLLTNDVRSYAGTEVPCLFNGVPFVDKELINGMKWYTDDVTGAEYMGGTTLTGTNLAWGTLGEEASINGVKVYVDAVSNLQYFGDLRYNSSTGDITNLAGTDFRLNGHDFKNITDGLSVETAALAVNIAAFSYLDLVDTDFVVTGAKSFNQIPIEVNNAATQYTLGNLLVDATDGIYFADGTNIGVNGVLIETNGGIDKFGNHMEIASSFTTTAAGAVAYDNGLTIDADGNFDTLVQDLSIGTHFTVGTDNSLTIGDDFAMNSLGAMQAFAVGAMLNVTTTAATMFDNGLVGTAAGITDLAVGNDMLTVTSNSFAAAAGDLTGDATGLTNLTLAGTAMLFDSSLGVFNNISDKKLKTNILTLNDGLEKILSIRPVSFNWNEEFLEESAKPEKNNDSLYCKQYGFVAQEFKDIIPELVIDYRDFTKRYKEERLTINYDKIVPFLVSAIQEQQKMIENMQKEVEYLKMKEL